MTTDEPEGLRAEDVRHCRVCDDLVTEGDVCPVHEATCSWCGAIRKRVDFIQFGPEFACDMGECKSRLDGSWVSTVTGTSFKAPTFGAHNIVPCDGAFELVKR